MAVYYVLPDKWRSCDKYSMHRNHIWIPLLKHKGLNELFLFFLFVENCCLAKAYCIAKSL